ALLVAGALLDDAAEAGDPGRAVGRGGTEDVGGEPRALEDRDLRAVEFLAAEVGRIDGVRIDEDGVDAGAPEHRRGHRAGQSAADYDNIRILHRSISAHPGCVSRARAVSASSP